MILYTIFFNKGIKRHAYPSFVGRIDVKYGEIDNFNDNSNTIDGID